MPSTRTIGRPARTRRSTAATRSRRSPGRTSRARCSTARNLHRVAGRATAGTAIADDRDADRARAPRRSRSDRRAGGRRRRRRRSRSRSRSTPNRRVRSSSSRSSASMRRGDRGRAAPVGGGVVGGRPRRACVAAVGRIAVSSAGPPSITRHSTARTCLPAAAPAGERVLDERTQLVDELGSADEPDRRHRLAERHVLEQPRRA